MPDPAHTPCARAPETHPADPASLRHPNRNSGTTKAPLETVDMWDTAGPGRGLNGSAGCSQANQAGCTYQDEVFVQRVAQIIANHSKAPTAPLFLFWAPHAPHDPYQVPQVRPAQRSRATRLRAHSDARQTRKLAHVRSRSPRAALRRATSTSSPTFPCPSASSTRPW